MSTAYIPWITPQDYQSIKRITRTHPGFPDTYDEWVYLTNKKIAEITAGGNIAERRSSIRLSSHGSVNTQTVTVTSPHLETSPLPKEAGNQFKGSLFFVGGKANALTFDTRELPSMLNVFTVMRFPHSLF